MSTLIEKISQASLIYKSTQNDEALTAWPLKKTQCKLWYYEDVPCSNYDIVICQTLYWNDGELSYNELATILGFNVIDDFEANPKRYHDLAEKEILDALLAPIITDELICINNDIVMLTSLGQMAIDSSLKRVFYECNYDFVENFGVKSESCVFPYKSDFDKSFTAKNSKRISFYNEVCKDNNYDVTPLPTNEENELVEAVCAQIDGEYSIFAVHLSKIISFYGFHVDNAIYSLDGIDFVVLYSTTGKISEFATNILNNEDNRIACNKKIEWGYYLRLLNNPEAVLNYDALAPFIDIIEWAEIVRDDRFDWNDHSLFSLLGNQTDSNLWNRVSETCPSDLLLSYLDVAVNLWDWNILSRRVNAAYIAEHATQYPWDYDMLLQNQSLTSDILETILLIPDLQHVEWNWADIIPLLSRKFISEHLDDIDFDLYQITKDDIELSKRCILSHPNSNWDWSYICSAYDLLFILDNMSILANHLMLKTIFDRIFVSNEYIESFLSSKDFDAAVQKTKNTIGLRFNVNLSSYIWNDKTIGYLESIGVLNWDTPIIPGFEANPLINWDAIFFEKYSNRIRTKEGFERVTERITDVAIIETHPDFPWNWNVISSNTVFIQNIPFVKSNIKKLNLTLLFNKINESIFNEIFELDEVQRFVVTTQEYVEKATQLASMDVVRNNIKFCWDWKVLTKKSISTLKIDKLGHPSWADKWDWDYLSTNIGVDTICLYLSKYSNFWNWDILSSRIDKEFIQSHLSEYENLWNWDIITRKLDKQFLLENIVDYSSSWDWTYIVENLLDKYDLKIDTHLVPIATCISLIEDELKLSLWKTITKKYPLEELCEIINKTIHTEFSDIFCWDILYLYNLPEFDLNSYVDNYPEDVDWALLSNSEATKRLFSHDKSMLSFSMWLNLITSLLKSDDYHWDYYALSRNDTINWHPGILSVNTSLWDWDYLSEFSNCFSDTSGSHLFQNIRKFKKWINFGILSTRNNLTFDDNLLGQFCDTGWDWYSLSSRNKFAISEAFILNNLTKNWDWKAISAKSPFKVTRDLINNSNTLFDRKLLSTNPKLKISLCDIVELGAENWEWSVISSRKDIIFDTDSAIELISKGIELDWDAFSRRTDFELVFDEDLIMLLYQLNKPVNWYNISTNSSFFPSQNVLSKISCKELNWEAISNNDKLELNVLWDYRNYINWSIISQREKFIVRGGEFLNKFRDYLSWDSISESSAFQLDDENLIAFCDKINWSIVAKRKEFKYSNKLIDSVAEDCLDWEDVSKSQDLIFSEGFIRKHIDFWDWKTLFNNPKIIEKQEFYTKIFEPQVNGIKFLERFTIDSPKIYHFAHLFNAINILKERKILSRNKAQGHFENSAGSNVHRRDTAHSYARFYYRPQSPTQYYNEGLGVDSHMPQTKYRLVGYTKYGKKIWDSYEECPSTKYYGAKRLDSPKCPMPVFFEFDLQEVINHNIEKCYYSTGNMQKDNSLVVELASDPFRLNTENVYSTIEDGIDVYKSYSQQEFLIKDYLDFSKLHKIRIICFDEKQANLLKKILGDDSICSNITTDSKTATGINVFHRENRSVQLCETDDYIKISTDYEDAYALEVNCKDIDSLHILDDVKKNITTINNSKIQAQHSIGFYKSATPITVRFVDLDDYGRRSWLLYSNEMTSIKEFENNQYLYIKKDMVSDFKNIANSLSLKLNRDIFHPRMFYSYHGIAHTVRVMWNSFALAKLSPDIDNALLIPILYSSFIHDLGKERDMEGEEHGSKSAFLYHDKIISILGEQVGMEVLEAVRYHSVDDNKCPASVHKNPIWIVLKDADALDRSRLPGKGCNPTFLRSSIFRTEVGKELIKISNLLPTVTEGLEWNNPVDELSKTIESYIL